MERKQRICWFCSGVLGELCNFFPPQWKNIQSTNKIIQNFRKCSAYIYFLNAAIVGIFMYILTSTQGTSNKEIKKSLKNLSPSTEVGYYLPGFYETKASKHSHRSELYIHFAYIYLMDTFYIYATMWTIYLAESFSYKESHSYNIGIQYGSLLLLFMVIVSKAFIYSPESLQGFLAKHFQLFILITSLTGIIIFFSPTPEMKLQALVLNAFLVGICNSVY